MKKIAIVLAGCGVYDGAEIHEAVMTMLAVKKAGAVYDIFAPDVEQAHVINHLNGEVMNEKRNVLVEAARIARGKIQPLSSFSGKNYDAIIFPGGFGVAKNLCTFAFDGVDMKVNPEVEKVIKEMLELNKPIGALCISPVMLAKIIGNGVELTIGNDKGTIQAIKSLGGEHKITDHGEIVFDRKYKVVTTPCYMLDAGIEQIAEGAENLVNKILELTD
ncbi:MAG TPA: isoprenoid biosynthesis glyoxalase ElbB [Bacteroidia bacterium]|nr:isoprenoid biosynthesis glyoxalase ElbB [Bacteroidia bacterium]HRS59184.1 isoprenoid biosynthesis glyoxalase ElbB [Bacteroidia bacterium]HRU67232.1 isoprenoid biosynthesis glyoxalase ElbB [Bacteroidia bacterium]